MSWSETVAGSNAVVGVRPLNWLHTFDVRTLGLELETSGLVVDSVYGDLTGADLDPHPREFCVVAKRS